MRGALSRWRRCICERCQLPIPRTAQQCGLPLPRAVWCGLPLPPFSSTAHGSDGYGAQALRQRARGSFLWRRMDPISGAADSASEAAAAAREWARWACPWFFPFFFFLLIHFHRQALCPLAKLLINADRYSNSLRKLLLTQTFSSKRTRCPPRKNDFAHLGKHTVVVFVLGLNLFALPTRIM